MLQRIREAEPLKSLTDARKIRIRHLLLQIVFIDALSEPAKIVLVFSFSHGIKARLPLVVSAGMYHVEHIAHSRRHRHIRHGHLDGLLGIVRAALL